MRRARIVLGLIAAVFLVLSSGAHSLLGWPQLHAQLAKAGAPADLIQGLRVGWHFGGVAMVAFGLILGMLFLDAFRGRAVNLRPALLIGVAYLAFGAWALYVSGMNPFFLIFIVPGLMAIVGASGSVAPPRETLGRTRLA